MYGNDLAMARERAIEDAMLKMVQQSMGTMVNSGLLLHQNHRIANSHLSLMYTFLDFHSAGLVKDHSVSAEKVAGDTVHVRITGTVCPRATGDAIKAVLASYGKPLFAVSLRETVWKKDVRPGESQLESVLREALVARGFNVLDQAQMLKALQASAKAGDMDKAVSHAYDRLRDEHGVEVLIYGTVRVNNQGQYVINDTTMTSSQCLVTLKAVDLYTASVLASVVDNAPGNGENDRESQGKSIRNCVSKIIEPASKPGLSEESSFIDQITSAFIKASSRRLIKFSIIGLPPTELIDLRLAMLNRVRGVKEVYPRGQVGSAAKWDVEYSGKTSFFTRELEGKAKSLGYAIEMVEVKPNAVTVKASRK